MPKLRGGKKSPKPASALAPTSTAAAAAAAAAAPAPAPAPTPTERHSDLGKQLFAQGHKTSGFTKPSPSSSSGLSDSDYQTALAAAKTAEMIKKKKQRRSVKAVRKFSKCKNQTVPGQSQPKVSQSRGARMSAMLSRHRPRS